MKNDREALFHHARIIARQSRETWEKGEVFLNLYGFCRNLSFVLLVGSPVLLVSGLLSERREVALLGAGLGAVGVGMLYRFLKFYRLYTFELFSAYPDLAPADRRDGAS